MVGGAGARTPPGQRHCGTRHRHAARRRTLCLCASGVRRCGRTCRRLDLVDATGGLDRRAFHRFRGIPGAALAACPAFRTRDRCRHAARALRDERSGPARRARHSGIHEFPQGACAVRIRRGGISHCFTISLSCGDGHDTFAGDRLGRSCCRLSADRRRVCGMD